MSPAVVLHRGEYTVNTPGAIWVGETGTIRLAGQRKLRLNIKLNYEIIRHPTQQGSYKIKTTSYNYSVRDKNDKELLRYDWHPDVDPAVKYPHLHIEDSALKKLHLPTSRITVEQVLRLLITQFNVKPRRRDWQAILETGMRNFEDHCSWRIEPR